MLEVIWANSFKKDFKRIQKRGKDPTKLMAVIELLRNQTPLPPKYADHPLSGKYVGYRDCHIEYFFGGGMVIGFDGPRSFSAFICSQMTFWKSLVGAGAMPWRQASR